MKFAYLLFLGLFALGQLQRIQLTPSIAVYLFDLLIIGCLGFSWFTARQKWIEFFKRLIRNKAFLQIMGLIFLSSCLNFILIGFNLSSLLYIGRIAAYTLFAISLSFHNLFSVKNYYRLWMGAGLVTAILGLTQYVLLPDTRLLRGIGWDDHYYRLIGTLFDPNFTGLLLSLTLILWQAEKLSKSWLKSLVSIVLLIAIGLTYSRASWVALLVGGGTLVGLKYQSHWKKVAVGLVSLILLGAVLLPQPGGEGVRLLRTASIYHRWDNNVQVLQHLRPHQWLVGRGLFVPFEPTELRELQTDTAHFPDNLLVFLFTSMGPIGLILSIKLLLRWGRTLYQKDKYLFAAFITILIHSQFNHSLFQPFIWLWLINLSSIRGLIKG